MTSEEIAEYSTREDLILNEGYYFSHAKVKQPRYILFDYHDQLLRLLERHQFLPYSIKNPVSYEKWYITKFNEAKRRFHLKIK